MAPLSTASAKRMMTALAPGTASGRFPDTLVARLAGVTAVSSIGGNRLLRVMKYWAAMRASDNPAGQRCGP